MTAINTPVASTEIDGLVYTTKLFPTTEGLIIMPKLADLLGESGLAIVIGAAQNPVEALSGDAGILAPILGNIASRAAENNGLLVIKELLQYTSCKNIKIGSNEVAGDVITHFDEHFQGRYMHLMKLAVWVARASFVRP